MGVLYSIINYYVSYFRNGNAILPSEIYAIETALNVSGNYHIDLNNQIPAVLFLVFNFYSGYSLSAEFIEQKK